MTTGRPGRIAAIAAACLGAVVLLDRVFPAGADTTTRAASDRGPLPGATTSEAHEPAVLPVIDLYVGARWLRRMACPTRDWRNGAVAGDDALAVSRARPVAALLLRMDPWPSVRGLSRAIGANPGAAGSRLADVAPWAGLVGARVELEWIRREATTADPGDLRRLVALIRRLADSDDAEVRSWASAALPQLAYYDDGPPPPPLADLLLDIGPSARASVLRQWCTLRPDVDAALRGRLADLAARGTGADDLDASLAAFVLDATVRAGAPEDEVAGAYRALQAAFRREVDGYFAPTAPAWAADLPAAADRFAAELGVVVSEVITEEDRAYVGVFGPLPGGAAAVAQRTWGAQFAGASPTSVRVLAPGTPVDPEETAPVRRFSAGIPDGIYAIGLGVGVERPRTWTDALERAAIACDVDPACGPVPPMTATARWAGGWSVEVRAASPEARRAARGIAARYAGPAPDVDAVEVRISSR